MSDTMKVVCPKGVEHEVSVANAYDLTRLNGFSFVKEEEAEAEAPVAAPVADPVPTPPKVEEAPAKPRGRPKAISKDEA